MNMTAFNLNNLPAEGWVPYKLREHDEEFHGPQGTINAIKIEETFSVEGGYEVSSGYLVVDARGYPSAVATNEFESKYEKA